MRTQKPSYRGIVSGGPSAARRTPPQDPGLLGSVGPLEQNPRLDISGGHGPDGRIDPGFLGSLSVCQPIASRHTSGGFWIWNGNSRSAYSPFSPGFGYPRHGQGQEEDGLPAAGGHGAGPAQSHGAGGSRGRFATPRSWRRHSQSRWLTHAIGDLVVAAWTKGGATLGTEGPISRI